MKAFILILLPALALASHDGKLWSRSHDGFTRYRDIAVYNAALGPSAPSLAVQGTALVGCFDADAERAYMSFEVPGDWAGSEDMLLKVYWTNESGDALADTETIKWVITYRVIDFDGGEVITNGDAVADTLTYTQSGAGTDLETHESTFTLDWDNATQPLTVGERALIQFSRAMTADSYTGDGCVEMFEISYTSDDFREH